MNTGKKANIAFFFIMLAVIVAFAFTYNASVTRTVADAAYNDKTILQAYNAEIIEKLTSKQSIDQWSEIVEQYEDIVIVIENGENEIVTRTVGRTWSALDVKVQTPFEYMGEPYLIKSSVYLLRDYLTDVRTLVQFIFVEFLIGLAAIALIFFAIYSLMLRPFKGVYRAIEEYDKTGKLKELKIKGYAGSVYKRFVSLTKNLESQQQTERRIIASISHDIKTPLTSIMGYTEQLQKENLSEERRKRYLSTVYAKSEEITGLIREFDDYLSLNTKQDLALKDVTLGEIYESIIEDYAYELENSGIEFEAFIRGDSNAVVSLDMSKFKRVLGNIFSNSVKHLTTAEKKIEATLDSDKDKIYISIDDSGKGVDDDKYEVIFEPFYTSDKGRKVAGLGLAICREITELHAGRIYAERSRLGGLRVCIELSREDTHSKRTNR